MPSRQRGLTHAAPPTRLKPLGALLAVLIWLTGCAATGPHDPIEDPLEGFNRAMFQFNDTADKVLIWPASTAYRDFLPQPVRTGIHNFFDNLYMPLTIVNDFLQGKGTKGFDDMTRFVMNSTFGILGIFDVATPLGLRHEDEDFGQTFAVWGMPEGWYVVWPILGPRTLLRDSLGWYANTFLDPLFYYEGQRGIRWGAIGLRFIDFRSTLPSPYQIEEMAVDPYIFVRESYRQNRWFKIYDGNVPEPEGGSPEDEFLFGDEPIGGPEEEAPTAEDAPPAPESQ
jgi:phospholipid-binding lipoprotein MlaA